MPSSPSVRHRTAAVALLLGLLAAAGLTLAATPDPLLPNGGFEDGAAGWGVSAGQLVIVTEPVRTGGRAGRLAASGVNQVAFVESGFVTVTAGTTYTLTGSVYYTDTAVSWTQLRITWYSDTTSTAMPVLSWSTPILAPLAGWQVFSPLVTTPPAGAHAAKVRAVTGLAALHQAGAAIFDDLSMQGPDSPTLTSTPKPPPSQTPTATATPAPLTTALPGDVLITEVQAHPASGGTAGEWLELYNRTGTAVVLAGWTVEDNHGADLLPIISMPPGAFAVVAAEEATFRARFPGFSGSLVVIADGTIGNGLADDGDRLVLRDGAGTAIDALSYGTEVSIFDPAAPAVAAGHSLERRQPGLDTDTAGDFADNASPSAGVPLPAATATVTATATRTATPSRTPRSTASPTPTASPTATASLTATRVPFTTALPGDVLIAEVQAHPASGGNSGEWLELYNRIGAAVVLAGWTVEDNHGADLLPVISLPPGAFAVVAADEAAFRARFPGYAGSLVAISDGSIGNGLADDGDRLVLRDGAGTIIDALSYGADVSIFNPAAPAVAAGHSLERWQPGLDTDTAADFVDNVSPSPGEPLPAPAGTATATPTRTATPSRTPTATPIPTPTASPTATWQPGSVCINEILPAPHEVDWDGDGTSGSGDEWIEIHNRSANAVDLGGWRLDDAAASGRPTYAIPAGQWIAAGGFVVFYHRQTSLTLNNDGDTVRLLYPDGSLAEAVGYTNARYDVSYSRTASGAWSWDYPPSPGRPNVPPPTPSPAPTATQMPVAPISHARGAARDAAIAVEGRVTVPPGVFGRRVAYITDGTAGMRIQHWSRDLPGLAEGDAVHVEGRMTTVYGEVTVNVRAISRMGGGQPAAPVVLSSGQMGSWWEGMLVRASGRVQRWDSDDIYLDDGAGPVQVRLRASTGLERPALVTGQHLSVTGVVGQSNGLWLLLPRWQSDLSTLPAQLPRAGERAVGAASCVAPLVGIYYRSPGGAGGCSAW